MAQPKKTQCTHNEYAALLKAAEGVWDTFIKRRLTATEVADALNKATGLDKCTTTSVKHIAAFLGKPLATAKYAPKATGKPRKPGVKQLASVLVDLCDVLEQEGIAVDGLKEAAQEIADNA